MGIIAVGMEGGWAQRANTLNGTYADTYRRGSSALGSGQSMQRYFTGSNDTWIHFRMGPNWFNWHNTNEYFRIYDAFGTVIVSLYSTGASSSLATYRRRTSSGVLSTAAGSIGGSGVQTYDFRIQVSTTTITDDTVTYTLYVNSVKRYEETFVDTVAFKVPGRVYCNSYLNPTYVGRGVLYCQDLIITDGVPTSGMELAYLAPDAAGTHSDMTGDYTAIDDVGYSAADFLVSPVVGDRESWTLGTVTIPSNKLVYSVCNNPVAVTDVGIADFNTFVRSGGVDYDEVALGVVSGTPQSFTDTLLTNPATGLAWTQADIDALEVGIRSS